MFQRSRCIWLVALMSMASSTQVLAEPEGNNTVPILGFMSGYNSCPSWYGDVHGTNMGIAAKRLLRRIKRETKAPAVEYVVSCFPRSASKVRFVTSYDRGEYLYHGYVDHIVEEITTLARKHPDHKVYLAGHSYGGWLAMYVVTQLPSWVNVGVVATIDPISTVNCAPSTFVRSYLSSSFNLRPASGCTQAPTDLSQRYIARRSGSWLNFYQAMYPLLHSGYIGHAHANEMYDYQTGYLEEFQAHVMIEEDARIWIRYNREVVQDLRKTSNME